MRSASVSNRSGRDTASREHCRDRCDACRPHRGGPRKRCGVPSVPAARRRGRLRKTACQPSTQSAAISPSCLPVLEAPSATARDAALGCGCPGTRGMACTLMCACVQPRVQPARNSPWSSELRLKSQSARRVSTHSSGARPGERLGSLVGGRRCCTSSAASVSALSVDALASGAKRERHALTASRCRYELALGLRTVGLHAQQHRRPCPIARHLLTTGRAR